MAISRIRAILLVGVGIGIGSIALVFLLLSVQELSLHTTNENGGDNITVAPISHNKVNVTYMIGCMDNVCAINWLSAYYNSSNTKTVGLGNYVGSDFNSTSQFIQDYFKKQGITVSDIQYELIWRSFCEYGECPDRYMLILSVSEQDVTKMQEQGFKTPDVRFFNYTAVTIAPDSSNKEYLTKEVINKTVSVALQENTTKGFFKKLIDFYDIDTTIRYLRADEDFVMKTILAGNFTLVTSPEPSFLPDSTPRMLVLFQVRSAQTDHPMLLVYVEPETYKIFGSEERFSRGWDIQHDSTATAPQR